jgi:hypothetical protein
MKKNRDEKSHDTVPLTATTFRVIFAPLSAGNADIACLVLVSVMALLVWDGGYGGEGDPGFVVHLRVLIKFHIHVLMLGLADILQAIVITLARGDLLVLSTITATLATSPHLASLLAMPKLKGTLDEMYFWH